MSPNSIHTVLVPGVGCSARVFQHLLPAVWEHGSAAVADTRRDDSLGGMADRLLASSPDRFVVVGFSMGAYVAFEVLRRAPERVIGFAVIDASGRDDTPERAEQRAQTAAIVDAGGLNKVVANAFPFMVHAQHHENRELAALMSTMAQEVGAAAYAAQLRAVMRRPDSRPLLGSISCPTAVIHGAEDRVVPVEVAHELATAIPDCMLTLLPDTGHMSPLEAGVAVGQALGDLLRRVRD